MQLTDKGLGEGCFFQRGLFLHHQKSHIAGLHLFEVLHLGLAHHLAKEQQKLRLAIGQCVPFDMVAVVVELNGKLTAQTVSVPFRQRLQSSPGLVCLFPIHTRYFFANIAKRW